jgi:hypothetical protein
MKRSSGPRKTANLSESIHRQLSTYALAAGAAGVGVLTLGQLSEAKIIYTAVHEVIGPKHQYNLDLNHDKVTDFSIQNAYACGQDWCGDHLSAIPATGNGVAGPTGFRLPYASALRAGALIGQKQPFPGQLMASYSGHRISADGLARLTATLDWSLRSKERFTSAGRGWVLLAASASRLR